MSNVIAVVLYLLAGLVLAAACSREGERRRVVVNERAAAEADAVVPFVRLEPIDEGLRVELDQARDLAPGVPPMAAPLLVDDRPALLVLTTLADDDLAAVLSGLGDDGRSLVLSREFPPGTSWEDARAALERLRLVASLADVEALGFSGFARLDSPR